jgi:hypothetical protein
MPTQACLSGRIGVLRSGEELTCVWGMRQGWRCRAELAGKAADL